MAKPKIFYGYFQEFVSDFQASSSPREVYRFFTREEGGAGTNLLSGILWQDSRERPEAVSGNTQAGYQEKVLHPKGGWALNKLPRSVVPGPAWQEFRRLLHSSLRHTVCAPSWRWSRARPGAGLPSFLWLPSNQGYSLVQLLQIPPGNFSPRQSQWWKAELDGLDQDVLMQTPLTSTATCINRELRNPCRLHSQN